MKLDVHSGVSVYIPEGIKAGVNTTIKVNVPDNTKNVTVYVNGNKVYEGLAGDINISGEYFPVSGDYEINVTYDGDGEYANETVTNNINVGKNDDYKIDIITPEDAKVGGDNIVEIRVPSDITGNVTVTVDGVNYNVTVGEDKVIRVNVSDLNAGNHTIVVNYNGDDKYASKNNTKEFVVDKITDYGMNITVPDDVKVGKNTTITVDLPKDAAGDVTITVGDDNYTAEVKNGVAVVEVPGLSEGSHNATVYYSGDDKYASSTQPTSIVSRKDASENMTVIIPDEINNLENFTIVVNGLPNDATGNVTITVDGKNYTKEVIGGSVSIIVLPLSAGDYNITTTYSGDVNYAPATNITAVVSRDGKYDMIVDVPIDIKVDVNSTITVKLPEKATGNVTITIGDNNYSAEVKNGVAVVEVPGLSEGSHNATVYYPGDDYYMSNSKNITILSREDVGGNMTVIVPEEVNDNENVTIVVNGLPGDATGNVTITVGGKNYTTDVKNGSASITIPPLVSGEHIVTATYWGDDKYAGIYNDTTLISKETKYNMTVNIPDDIKAGENITIGVDLPGDATGNVTITVDGKNYTKEVINGSVSIIISPLTPGEHNITTTYSGDNKYVLFTENDVLNVKSSIVLDVDDVVMYYKDGSKLAAVLTNGGNPVANKTISFTINGVSYNRTTDGNGTAYLNLNLEQGNYTAIVSFNNTSKNASVVIKSTIISDNLVKMFMNGTQFYATFIGEGGKVLANTNVTFNINGVFYTKTTDVNGTAKLNIRLNPGNYTLTAYNPFNGEQKGFNVLVKPLIVENYDITKYFLNGTQYSAKVYNKNGSLAVGEIVTFNVHGVFYNRTVGSDGYVHLNINLNPGDYIITAIYDGCMVSNDINVKPTLETSDFSMKYGDGSVFQAKTLDGQGRPLANQNLTFNIHGVFYHKTTDVNGMAELNINLMRGEYIITSYWNNYQIGNKIKII